MPNENNILTTVILSSAVFAALISSLSNLIISLINNRRLKVIEKQKNMTEIDKYRYTKLYEMLFNWYKYDSEIHGENPGEIAYYRLLDRFLENDTRYEIIRPLLDEHFVVELDEIRVEVNKLLNDLIDAEKPNGTHTDDFPNISDKYMKNGMMFSNKLKDVIYQQLKMLLMKQ